MTNSITAFKGFDRNLKCRGFQYEVGKTYEQDEPASLCNTGFHAVTLPLDVFTYYRPGPSVFHRVELEDVTSQSGDSKIAGRKITIGASLGIPGIIRAHVEAIWNTVKKPSEKTKATTGDYANAATTGYSSHAATTGDSSNAATTGYSSHAATTGDSSHAATTGRYANAATTGYSESVRASVKDETAVAAVLGQGAASGAVGSVLFLIERDDSWNITAHTSIRIDGEKYKADTFYTLRDGRIVKA